VEKAESLTGAGIGGGFGGEGCVVYIEGGTVNAYANEDASGFLSAGAAIGGGSSSENYMVYISGADTKVTATAESGAGIGGSDSLGINYDAAVTADDDEEHAQYATVSAESDGRKDACRQRWAKISSCDHQDAGTYTVPSPDGSGTEIHCAHCGAYLGMQNRQETIPANSSKPTATLSTAKPSTASSVAASSKSTTPLSRTADPTTSMAGIVAVAITALACGSVKRD
jgi:hypothetical protein